MGWEALLAGGLQLYGSTQAQKAARRDRDHIKQLYAFMRAKQFDSFGRARANYLGAVRHLNEGYDTALTGVRAGQTARRSAAIGQGSQARANLAQSLVSRGLYNTGAYDAYSTSLTTGINSQLDAIDAAAEQTRAQLAVARGQALASGEQMLGNMELGMSEANIGLLSQQMNDLYLNREHAAPSDWAEGLGALAGSLSMEDIGGALGSLGGSLSAGTSMLSDLWNNYDLSLEWNPSAWWDAVSSAFGGGE